MLIERAKHLLASNDGRSGEMQRLLGGSYAGSYAGGTRSEIGAPTPLHPVREHDTVGPLPLPHRLVCAPSPPLCMRSMHKPIAAGQDAAYERGVCRRACMIHVCSMCVEGVCEICNGCATEQKSGREPLL